jgi:hypothetical protein
MGRYQDDRDHDWEELPEPYLETSIVFRRALKCTQCGMVRLTEVLWKPGEPEDLKPKAYWTGYYYVWDGWDDCRAVIRNG